MSRSARHALLGAVLACGLVLSGCASGGPRPPADPARPDAGKRIVYSGAQNADAYIAIACGVKERARDLGVSIDVQSPPQFTAAAAAPVINAAAAGRPDGMIVSPADANALAAPIAGVKAQGIPVVTALNTLADPAPLAAQVLADDEAGGRRSAELVAEHLAGRPGKVALLTYTPGKSVPADSRARGFEAGIRNVPNVQYLGPQIVGIDPSASTAVMNAVLARDPDVTAVVASFGRSGDGAAAAIRQRGPGSAPVYLVTFDSYAGVVDDLHRGEVSALIDYDLPGLGRIALDRVLAAGAGRPVTPKTSQPPIVYTQQTIGDPAVAPALQATPCPV